MRLLISTMTLLLCAFTHLPIPSDGAPRPDPPSTSSPLSNSDSKKCGTVPNQIYLTKGQKQKLIFWSDDSFVPSPVSQSLHEKNYHNKEEVLDSGVDLFLEAVNGGPHGPNQNLKVKDEKESPEYQHTTSESSTTIEVDVNKKVTEGPLSTTLASEVKSPTPDLITLAPQVPDEEEQIITSTENIEILSEDVYSVIESTTPEPNTMKETTFQVKDETTTQVAMDVSTTSSSSEATTSHIKDETTTHVAKDMTTTSAPPTSSEATTSHIKIETTNQVAKDEPTTSANIEKEESTTMLPSSESMAAESSTEEKEVRRTTPVPSTTTVQSSENVISSTLPSKEALKTTTGTIKEKVTTETPDEKKNVIYDDDDEDDSINKVENELTQEEIEDQEIHMVVKDDFTLSESDEDLSRNKLEEVPSTGDLELETEIEDKIVMPIEFEGELEKESEENVRISQEAFVEKEDEMMKSDEKDMLADKVPIQETAKDPVFEPIIFDTGIEMTGNELEKTDEPILFDEEENNEDEDEEESEKELIKDSESLEEEEKDSESLEESEEKDRESSEEFKTDSESSEEVQTDSESLEKSEEKDSESSKESEKKDSESLEESKMDEKKMDESEDKVDESLGESKMDESEDKVDEILEESKMDVKKMDESKDKVESNEEAMATTTDKNEIAESVQPVTLHSLITKSGLEEALIAQKHESTDSKMVQSTTEAPLPTTTKVQDLKDIIQDDDDSVDDEDIQTTTTKKTKTILSKDEVKSEEEIEEIETNNLEEEVISTSTDQAEVNEEVFEEVQKTEIISDKDLTTTTQSSTKEEATTSDEKNSLSTSISLSTDSEVKKTSEANMKEETSSEENASTTQVPSGLIVEIKQTSNVNGPLSFENIQYFDDPEDESSYESFEDTDKSTQIKDGFEETLLNANGTQEVQNGTSPFPVGDLLNGIYKLVKSYMTPSPLEDMEESENDTTTMVMPINIHNTRREMIDTTETVMMMTTSTETLIEQESEEVEEEQVIVKPDEAFLPGKFVRGAPNAEDIQLLKEETLALNEGSRNSVNIPLPDFIKSEAIDSKEVDNENFLRAIKENPKEIEDMLSRKRRDVEDKDDNEEVNCSWNIKTEDDLYLLVTFHNLSAPFTVDCEGAFIEVERENNGFDARWCGNRVLQGGTSPHVIFAKGEVRVTVFDDGNVGKNFPTGFSAEVEVIDLFDGENPHVRSEAYSNVKKLVG